MKIRAKDRPQSVKELQKALEGTCDKEENKKEIKPLILTPIKEEGVLKNKNISKKENIGQKSIFLLIIGTMVLGIVVGIIGVNWDDRSYVAQNVSILLVEQNKNE